jgi:hypothetical protein
VEKITEIGFFLLHEARFGINLLYCLQYVFFITEYAGGTKNSLIGTQFNLCY